jgi:hypothetical protein
MSADSSRRRSRSSCTIMRRLNCEKPLWMFQVAMDSVCVMCGGPCRQFIVPGAIHTRMWKGLKSVFLSYQSSASARLRKATTR